MARRHGRGRLSSIELLPPEAEPIVAWAMGEVRDRRRHQVDILPEFNARLATLATEIGRPIKPISLSAFNRQALRLTTQARRLEETREIAGALTRRLKPGDTDDLTVMVAESIKTLIFELLEAGGEAGFTPKEAMEMARAVQAAAGAQKVSSERRVKMEKEFADRATAAVDAVGKAKGLTAETIQTIKQQILGVRA